MRTLLLWALLIVLKTAAAQVIQLKDSRFTLLPAFQPTDVQVEAFFKDGKLQ